jgi:hypothetical protein
MRNTLLATVAAAALAAGTVMVSAQGMGGAGGGSPPSAAPPPSSAPAEKMDRKGGASERGAQTAPKGERSTTGQTERGGAGQTERGQTQERSGTTREPAERGQANPSNTREQAPKAGDTQRGATSKDGDTQRGATSKDGDTPRGAATKDGDSQRGAASKEGGSSGSASLSTEQRTKIKTTVLQGGGAPKVSRTEINFNISVGTAVPRSVRLVTVPTTIVEIHPAWRGYMYFVVDDEIIIVEPGSLRIVAVIT